MTMQCDWCDEAIIIEEGDYKIAYTNPTKVGSVTRWDELWFHDHCFEDGTRDMTVTEDIHGEAVIK